MVHWHRNKEQVQRDEIVEVEEYNLQTYDGDELLLIASYCYHGACGISCIPSFSFSVWYLYVLEQRK